MTSSCNVCASFSPSHLPHRSQTFCFVRNHLNLWRLWFCLEDDWSADGNHVAVVSVGDTKSHAHCFADITKENFVYPCAVCARVHWESRNVPESDRIDIVSLIRWLMQSSIFCFYHCYCCCCCCLCANAVEPAKLASAFTILLIRPSTRHKQPKMGTVVIRAQQRWTAIISVLVLVSVHMPVDATEMIYSAQFRMTTVILILFFGSFPFS